MRDVREGKYVIVIVFFMSIINFILRGSDARCVRCQLLITLINIREGSFWLQPLWPSSKLKVEK